MTSSAAGPLVVSVMNPRYFAVASDERKAVYRAKSWAQQPLAAGTTTSRWLDGGRFLRSATRMINHISVPGAPGDVK